VEGTLASQLLSATDDDRQIASIVVNAEFQPSAGRGAKIFPLTTGLDRDSGNKVLTDAKPYLFEPRLVDGGRRDAVVIDQVPSQANRAEEALLKAVRDGRVELPLLELTVPTTRGSVVLTSLDAPHRYADAYWRDSLVDGERFASSPLGKRLLSATDADVSPLYEREPYSLLYGAWTSRTKGRQSRFARSYISEMYGLDAVLGVRAAGRMDPFNLTGAVDDVKKAESDWKFVASGEKKAGQKPSEIGLGNIRPGAAHGGVTVSVVHRRAVISLARLEQLRFGPVAPGAAHAARAALAALALAGDRLAFGRPSLHLRSGCDLTLQSEVVGLERAGGRIDAFEDLTAAAALAAFEELRERAAELGLLMARDIVAVSPYAELAKAIVFSVTNAEAAEGE
jgi:CRISPR-associated protein Csb1